MEAPIVVSGAGQKWRLHFCPVFFCPIQPLARLRSNSAQYANAGLQPQGESRRLLTPSAPRAVIA